MADHSKYNNSFTAEDIERYYNGKMSSLEMHELEKAAMEDPFLADALEGYSHTPTPVQDMDYLRTQLLSKTESGKLAPIGKGFSKNQFLRIAALFILLAGCGWAVYQFGFNKPVSEVVALKKPASLPPVINDSNENNVAQSDQSASVPATGTETQITTVQDDGRGSLSISTQNRHTGKINSGAFSKKEKVPNEGIASAETPVVNEVLQDEASSLNKAKVVDARKDTAAGYMASAPQTVSAGKENIIVMQRNRSSEPIPEVVLGNIKRDSNYRKPRVSFEEAEPENGTAYYDDYVIQNLQMPEEELKKNISGEVKLSFEINDAGEPVNITVEKSLCSECDKEAVRILKEGPKWKKKKEKKGKLSIKF